MSGNRTPSSSIVSAREPKHGHPVMPTEPNDDRIPVARQWLLAMRGFVKKSLDRADYVVREIETRLYPGLRHVDGCPAVTNDELHCPDDVYTTDHTAECRASSTTREGENLEQASPICACPKTLVTKGCPDRELRLTLRCILESLIDLTEQAPIRKFGADEMFYFPSRDGYMALVTEIEYLRARLTELDPGAAPRLGAPEIVRAADAKDEADATATQTG
ncbi:MAG TPA: hypothetical protein VIJ22_17675 [Polyangiaceae bacterium]